MLAIEIIEGCNFKCYFCPAKDLDQFTYMSLDLFKRIVLEAKEIGIKKLNLTPCMGEPFLHPDIYEILSFANEHMEESMLFTNATAINVNRLKELNLSRVSLNVSYYGSEPGKFIELTCTTNSLFGIFHKRLKELKDAGIAHQVHRRDQDYVFDYIGGPDVSSGKLDPKDKCKYHHEPKIFANGDVTFCIFAREEFRNSKKLFYTNVNHVSLREALEHPLRYKFYDSQSICASHCSSHDRDCYTGHSITSIKLISVAKKKYNENPDEINKQYQEIEREII